MNSHVPLILLTRQIIQIAHTRMKMFLYIAVQNVTDNTDPTSADSELASSALQYSALHYVWRVFYACIMLKSHQRDHHFYHVSA